MVRWKNVVVASIVAVSMLSFGGLAGAESKSNSDVELTAPAVFCGITPSEQKIKRKKATARWKISWGGGNGRYVVDFSDGNGGGYYNPNATFTSRSESATFTLGGSVTTKTWYQALYVSSVGGSDRASAKVIHNR